MKHSALSNCTMIADKLNIQIDFEYLNSSACSEQEVRDLQDELIERWNSKLNKEYKKILKTAKEKANRFGYSVKVIKTNEFKIEGIYFNLHFKNNEIILNTIENININPKNISEELGELVKLKISLEKECKLKINF